MKTPVLLTALTAAPLCLAQSINSASTFDPLVVTATRSHQDTRAKVVVNEQQLEQLQPDSVAAALRHQANIQPQGGPRASAQQPNIRGLSDNRVLQVVDGARQNLSAGHRGNYQLDPVLLKEIVVLKGPASTLWGSGALGGVVAQQTRDAFDFVDATQNWGGYLKPIYHSADEKLGFNAALAYAFQPNHALLLNGYQQHSHDIQLGNGETLQHSALQQRGGLLRYSWQLSDVEQLDVSVRRADASGAVPSNPTSNAGRSSPLVSRDSQQNQTLLSYRIQDEQLWNGQISLAYDYNHFDELRLDTQANDLSTFRTLSLQSQNSSHLSWATLSYAFDIYQDIVNGERQGANRPQIADARNLVWGLGLQASMPLPYQFTLIPALRYDQFRSEDVNQSSSKRNDDAWSPSLALQWQGLDWLTLSARYDQAFRAPSSEELYTTGTHFCMGPRVCNRFVANPDLQAEQAHNLELAARLQWQQLRFADHLAFAVTWFDNHIDNFIEQQVINDFASFTFETRWENVRKAQLTGIEAAVNYQIAGWQADIQYGQTQGRDKNDNSPLWGIPADQWKLHLAYQWHQNWRIGSYLSLVGAQHELPATTTEHYDNYQLLDLYLVYHQHGLQRQGWQVALSADNLTDEYYRPAFEQLYMPGRHLKLSVGYQF